MKIEAYSKLEILDKLGRSPIEEQNKIYHFLKTNKVTLYDVIQSSVRKGRMIYRINTDKIRITL